MEIQLSFTCLCGGFIEETINTSRLAVVDGYYASIHDYTNESWETFICSACSKDHDALFFINSDHDVSVRMHNVFDLHYEVISFEEYDESLSRIYDVNKNIYLNIMRDINSILESNSTTETHTRTLNNMLYAQTVSAIEYFLSSSFINTVIESNELIRRFVESESEFSKKKIEIGEIYKRSAALKDEISDYLNNLIFHNIKKIKPMFENVLDIDFGDVSWLHKAIAIRHDCVHRCGFKKNGNQNPISKEEIVLLIENSTRLISLIDSRLNMIKTARLVKNHYGPYDPDE